MRDRPVHVVVIESLSYTGTTWLNLILGCHPRAIGIGPPDRARNLRSGETACLVHGARCDFWPGFFEGYRPKENFFIQLADYSGRDYIITNNPVPDGAGKDLRHPDVWVHRMRVVRDARGVFASWIRNHPEAEKYRDDPGLSRVEAVERHARVIRGEYQRADPENPGVLLCKYEDVLADKTGWLERFSRFLGIEYSSDAYRYWDHDIHPTSGNQGTISLIKFAQGERVPENYRDREFYEKQFERAVSDQPFEWDRWKGELDESTAHMLDVACYDFLKGFEYPLGSYSLETVVAAGEEIRSLRDSCPCLFASWRKRFGEPWESGEEGGGEVHVLPKSQNKGEGGRLLSRFGGAVESHLPAPLARLLRAVWARVDFRRSS